MVVVLLPASAADPSLQRATASELARLGVTNVAVLRDERTVGLVLEGWAFDPSRSTEALIEALAGPGSRVRTLHPLYQMAVAPAPIASGGEMS